MMTARARSVLYLTWLSARFSVGRLVGITVGVSLGVTLLLLLVGAATGLSDRDHRAAWLREQGSPSVEYPQVDAAASGPPRVVPLTSNTVLLDRYTDVFRDRTIERRTVAATPDSTVEIPGVGHAPRPGTYYASPALEELIRTTPPDQLGNRYGTYAGRVADSALAGPDSLVIVEGATESELRTSFMGSAALVSRFTGDPYGSSAANYQTLIAMGAIAVLVPVLLLIGISTRWGETVRAERMGVLRLIGATPGTMSAVAATEAAVTALTGSLLGVALARVLRPVAASIPVGETRLFPFDLAVSPWLTLGLVVVITALAAVLAAQRTRQEGSRASAARSAPAERRVTIRRAVPFVAGVLLLAVSTRMPRWSEAAGSVAPLVQITGFFLTVWGSVLVGPWLLRLVSRFYLRRAQRPASVVAGHRMLRRPRTVFRAVSGLVTAVFVVSVFSGIASSAVSPDQPPEIAGVLPPGSVYVPLAEGVSGARAGEYARQAHARDGIDSAVVVYGTAPYGTPESGDELYVPSDQVDDLGLLDAPDTPFAAVAGTFLSQWNTTPMTPETATDLRTDSLVPFALVLGTDGSAAATDRARTFLATVDGAATPPVSRGDLPPTWNTRLIATMSVLANLGMLVALVIAGLSLAVSTAASILERRRTFAMLRLTGAPMSLLRGIVIREAVVPLVTAVLASAVLGYGVAVLVVSTVDDTRSVHWPDSSYFLTLGVGAALAVGSVLAACALLRQHRSVTVTRFE